MQIVHSVMASDDECLALLKLAQLQTDVKDSPAYSAEEKEMQLMEQQKKFKYLLAEYIHEAFTYGYNEGMNNANVKDTDMYRPMSPMRIME